MATAFSPLACPNPAAQMSTPGKNSFLAFKTNIENCLIVKIAFTNFIFSRFAVKLTDFGLLSLRREENSDGYFTLNFSLKIVQ